MKPTGILLICVALLAPLIWLPGIAPGRDVIALFSQYLGMMALIAMAISQLIATRAPGIEAIFGPLDQSYRIHKWLGIGAMVAILLHDTIDADMRGLGVETALVETAETAGEISLYGLLIFVVITIATFIPYHLWKWTHRFIGIFFVLGAFHYLFILKPFKNGGPLGIYMTAICAVGVLAYFYTSAPRGLRPGRQYQISNLERQGSALAVTMKPLARPLAHRAGQFAFFRFAQSKRSEPHPFTISSAPQKDGALRVTIAPLGDLTSQLSRSLEVGQSVSVDGAYGRFGQNPRGPQIWIAAGIGVTPFLSLARALGPESAPVTLIYAVRNAAEAAHLDEIRALADGTANLSVIIWESAESGRITADDLARIAKADLNKIKVLFCGPTPMRRSLASGLSVHGVSARRFHYEAFEICTGLGLRRLLGWLNR